MSTNASRNTTTGLIFENENEIIEEGIELTKYKMYTYLKEKNIDWKNFLSRKLLPDTAYFNPATGELKIYEKKFQQTDGSADEKPQTCAFKIFEYNKIGKAIGAKTVTYTYLLSDWFKQDKYKDMLDYIKSVPGCDYYFAN